MDMSFLNNNSLGIGIGRLKYEWNNGGKPEDDRYKGNRDCVTRAIAIATGQDYEVVWNELEKRTLDFPKKKRSCKTSRALTSGRASSSPSTGVFKKVYGKYLKELGWTWVPTMHIGSGCTVHMRADELPSGTIICRVSKHLCTVIDGVMHDNHNCSRRGTRCVYGYYTKTKGTE